MAPQTGSAEEPCGKEEELGRCRSQIDLSKKQSLVTTAPGQQVMDIQPLDPGASTATTDGGDNPPGQAAPLPFTQGTGSWAGRGHCQCAHRSDFVWPQQSRSSRKTSQCSCQEIQQDPGCRETPTGAAPAPPLRRTPRVTHSAPVARPEGEEGEGSKVKTVTYNEPYIPWRPTQEQLWECHYLLHGEGKFNIDGHISCLPSNDERRVGNKKWLCTWQQCKWIMSSQGEARAHVLAHKDLYTTAPVCACNKSVFANAKTLGTHLCRFHNVTLAQLRQEGNPLNILENPQCSICK